jgi:hypothetical protein
VVIAASLGLCACLYLAQRRASAAEDAFWALRGPPCPTMAASAYDRAWGTAQVTRYGGADFEYRVGHMMCTRRRDPNLAGGGPLRTVCQFTGPVFLSVATARGRSYFEAPHMHAVRVAVVDGQARCVLIPPFRMSDHR